MPKGPIPVPAEPILPLDSVRGYLRASVPDWEWLVSHLQSQMGWIRFPVRLIRAIDNLKVSDYPRLYEDEFALSVVGALAFFEPVELRSLFSDIEAANLQQRGELLNELISLDSSELNAFVMPLSAHEYRAQAKAFRRLSKPDQANVIKQAQYLLSSFLASFHQQLSMMLHGEKLTDLVHRAKLGDRQAFLKVVQLDNRTLLQIPEMSRAFLQARLAGDYEFCEAVGRRLMAPPYRGKIQHKGLWMSMSFLDMTGWLEHLSDRAIVDLLDEVGLGHKTKLIADVGGFAKCRRDYKQLRSQHQISTQRT